MNRGIKLKGRGFRRATIVPVTRAKDAPESDPDLYEVVVSTDDPIRRYDWWEGRFFFEVLGHEKDEIDLRYFENNATVLEEHRGVPIGVVRKAWIADGQLRALISFSKVEPRGIIVEGKVREGTVNHTSVGYDIERYERIKQDKEAGDTYRASRWMPMEVSAVGIPADLGAGFNRGMEHGPEAVVPVDGREAEEEVLVKKKVRNEAGAIIEVEESDPRPAVDASTEDHQRRIGGVLELCEAHKVPMAQARSYIERGLDAKAVGLEILSAMRTEPTPQPVSDPLDGLNKRDRGRYLYSRAILGAINEREGKKFDGLEREVHDALNKRLDSTIKRRGGIFIPIDLRTDEQRMIAEERRMATRVLDTKTPGKGAETIFEQPGELIEILRQASVLARLGARFLTGLTAPVAFPKHTGRLTANWVAENPGVDVAESDLGYGLVNLVPKTIQATTGYDRQFLVQSTLDAESEIKSELGIEHGLLLDRSGLHGEGAANEPTGIYKAPDVNVRAVGGIPDYADVVDSIGSVADDNALAGNLAWVTTPLMAAKLKQIPEHDTLAVAKWLWEGTFLDGNMAGYRAFASNQVSKTMTGSEDTGGAEHGAIFGNWNELLVGLFAGVEIIVDPFAKKKQGLIEVTSFQMADIALRHGESFVKWTGATIV